MSVMKNVSFILYIEQILGRSSLLQRAFHIDWNLKGISSSFSSFSSSFLSSFLFSSSSTPSCSACSCFACSCFAYNFSDSISVHLDFLWAEDSCADIAKLTDDKALDFFEHWTVGWEKDWAHFLPDSFGYILMYMSMYILMYIWESESAVALISVVILMLSAEVYTVSN